MFSCRFLNPPPLRFPQKLWKIANECKTGAVSWSPDGKSILVRYSLFREEFMSSTDDFFKTDNISSFVRQLNLYGFRKVYKYSQKAIYKSSPDLHEFSNPYFQQGRPDLLVKVNRKYGVSRDRNDMTENRKAELGLVGDTSSEKWKDGSITVVEGSGQTHMCRQEPAPLSDNPRTNEREQKTVDCAAKESSHTTDSVLADKSETAIPPNPVKKKRGRKPGVKIGPYESKDIVEASSKAISSPVTTNSRQSKMLKQVRQWPSLVYLDDDDPPTEGHPSRDGFAAKEDVLRTNLDDDDEGLFPWKTSREMVLPPAMSFRKTLESVALCEILQRLRDMKDECDVY